ncbi:MAG TPA: Uma2 family endonuclease [Verrucomicrobiae bacterium]|nr:Uma2 family endonuclease [Verrucomicrobiae bacterium]
MVMARTTARKFWTHDEMLAELPETAQPFELWDGEIVKSPSPHPNHQRIVLRFCERLSRFVAGRKLGEVFVSPLDVVLSPRRVVQPDVFFISHRRKDIVKDYIRGVPDLAVEIISEGTWERDRVAKRSLYEQFRLPEYWIVDPESRTIEVFALVGGSYQVHSRGQGKEQVSSRLLKGFKLTFEDLETQPDPRKLAELRARAPKDSRTL